MRPGTLAEPEGGVKWRPKGARFGAILRPPQPMPSSRAEQHAESPRPPGCARVQRRNLFQEVLGVRQVVAKERHSQVLALEAEAHLQQTIGGLPERRRVRRFVEGVTDEAALDAPEQTGLEPVLGRRATVEIGDER